MIFGIFQLIIEYSFSAENKSSIFMSGRGFNKIYHFLVLMDEIKLKLALKKNQIFCFSFNHHTSAFPYYAR